MRNVRWLALVAVLAVALTLVAGTASGQTNGSQKPQATEVGVTPTEIHVGVIADVDSPIAPNLFLGAVDAVKGYAKYVNATGGLAGGRKLVVDFYDSKINPNETRNGEISACANDFAMVGTSAVFLTNVDDMRGCKDKAGATTGIPDIPFIATARVQGCSDETYPAAGLSIQCATQNEHPQTYDSNIGRVFYFQKKYGKDLHGIYVFGNDSKPARDAQFESGGQMRAAGVPSDEDFDRSGRAQQAEYTAVIQSIKNHNSTYASCTSVYTCTVLLRKEAALQGVTSVKVWDCGTQCYDKEFLKSGGSEVEGEYVDTLYLPFYDKKEQKASPALANFVKYTGADKTTGFGVYAWSAADAFRTAVDAVVKKDGVNGLTRKNLFAALNNIHSFNAGGMIGNVDFANRKTTACHVISQVQNGTFVRVFPKKPGTLDCAKKNVIQVKLDLGS